MVWASTSAGQCVLLNDSWVSFRGAAADTRDVEWSYGIHPSDQEATLTAFARAHEEKVPFTRAYRVQRADGVFRWVHDVGAPWFDADGRFVGHVGVCVDTTDTSGPNRSTARSPRDVAELIDASQDIVYRIGLVPTVSVEYIGGNVKAITGRTAAEFYADPHSALRALHPFEAPRFPWRASEAVPDTFTHPWIHADGTAVWTEDHRRPVYGPDGYLIAVEGVARDVTARIESERRLRESEEQMRHLAARLQEAREEERTTIARELHDEVGQILTALKLELHRAVAAFGSAQSDVTTINRLQSVVGLADLGISAVKRLSSRLRPATLDHLGLAEAIRWEALAFKARTGIRCQVQASRREMALTPEQQTALFRIAQEAMNNVVCHSRASAVLISLRERDARVEMRIRDNGRGITTAEATAPSSIGLRGMKERAALVGGVFKISGQRGSGTVVSVVIPRGHIS